MKVSKYDKEWEHDIINYFQSVHPYADMSNATVTVNFVGKDANRGVAAGMMSINDKIFVPVVIKDFDLKAMDMFVDSTGEVYPFTEATFNAVAVKQDFGEVSEFDRNFRTRSNESLHDDLQYGMSDTGGYGFAPYADSGEVQRKLERQYSDVDTSNELLMATLARYYNMPALKMAAAPVVVTSDLKWVESASRFDLRGKYVKFAAKIPVKIGAVHGRCVIVYDDAVSWPFDVRAKTADGYLVESPVGRHTIKISEDIAGIEFVGSDVYLGHGPAIIPLESDRIKAVPTNRISKVARGYIFNGDKIASEALVEKLAETYTPGSIYIALGMLEAVGSVVLPIEHKIAEVSTFDFMKVASLVRKYDAPTINGVTIKDAGVNDGDASDTVDALLGLNFANISIIKSFMGKLGVLVKAKNVLGKMLVYSMLTEAFDSDTVSNALHAIQDTIDELRSVQK